MPPTNEWVRSSVWTMESSVRSRLGTSRRKRMEQARSVYGRYADKVNGRRAVAGSFREERKYEDAVRHYLALVGLDKEREATWQQDVVSTWREASQWDKAIATYRTLLTVDPDRHSDWNWGIAECYEKKGTVASSYSVLPANR